MRSCRVDKIEAAIITKLSNKISESSSTKKYHSKLLKEIERLNHQKFTLFQDYKEGEFSRDKYLEKRVKLDRELVTLEQIMKEYVDVPLSIGKKLTKEIVDKYVDKVIVDCLGFFKVIYK